MLEGNAREATATRFARSLHHFWSCPTVSINPFDGVCDDSFGEILRRKRPKYPSNVLRGAIDRRQFCSNNRDVGAMTGIGRGAAAPAKSFGEGGKWADRNGRASVGSGFRLVFVVEG